MEFLKANVGSFVFFAIVVIAWLLLRTPASRLDSIGDLDALLARGEPEVLEVFTNT
jgi:hypothetical protein